MFPLVGSIRVSPGRMRPLLLRLLDHARRPIRSFTEPPAFRNSHLARISQPVSCPTVRSRTIGVWPIGVQDGVQDLRHGISPVRVIPGGRGVPSGRSGPSGAATPPRAPVPPARDPVPASVPGAGGLHELRLALGDRAAHHLAHDPPKSGARTFGFMAATQTFPSDFS